MNEFKDDLLSITPNVKSTEDMAKDIINSTSRDNVKSLIDQFNLNQTKRSALRVATYERLLERVSEEIGERMDKCPDTFSNLDLLKYMQALQDAMDKSNNALKGLDELPTITTNQVTINNEVNVFNSESRRKIEDAVTNILALATMKKVEDLAKKEVVVDVTEDSKLMEEIDEMQESQN